MESDNIEEIKKCESRGLPNAIVSIGDIIFFKDCKDIPLYYGIVNKVLYSSKDFSEVYQRATVFFNELLPYEVSEIT